MPTKLLTIPTNGTGLYEFTSRVQQAVDALGVEDGLCTVMVQHTSASLLIQENADPSARHDLEAWLDRLVPERDTLYTHTSEGPDDMPAHIKAALTATTLGIPIMDGRLALGTWQGIYTSGNIAAAAVRDACWFMPTDVRPPPQEGCLSSAVQVVPGAPRQPGQWT